MTDVTEMTTDQLLATFLDACRDRNQPAAFDAIHELRYRVWCGSPLPRDVRPDPKEQAKLRRMSALWRAERDSLRERTRDPGKGFRALRSEVTAVYIDEFTDMERKRKGVFPFCVDPTACAANGGRCPRDPVCGN